MQRSRYRTPRQADRQSARLRGGETTQLRHSRAPSRESRGNRRDIARFRPLQLKPNAPDDLWILGTGPENDDALKMAPPASASRNSQLHEKGSSSIAFFFPSSFMRESPRLREKRYPHPRHPRLSSPHRRPTERARMITGIVRGPAGGVRDVAPFRRAGRPGRFRGAAGPSSTMGGVRIGPLDWGHLGSASRHREGSPHEAAASGMPKGSGPGRCIGIVTHPRGMPEADRMK